jgi:hypothetical protein
MQRIETYPLNIPTERKADLILHQALVKTVTELFPNGLRDNQNQKLLISNLEWWRVGDDPDAPTIIVCPKNAYPRNFTIEKDLETNTSFVVSTERDNGPYDWMTWSMRGKNVSGMSVVAHRPGYPLNHEDLLNLVERLNRTKPECISPGLANGILVVCYGCRGEFGVRHWPVYGWNMDTPEKELSRRPVEPIYMKSFREAVIYTFSSN